MPNNNFKTDANDNTLVSMGTGLNAIDDSVRAKPHGMTGVRLTASGLVFSGASILKGMYVASVSGGTVLVYNNTAGSGPILINTITPAVGWHMLGDLEASTGIYVVITGTIDVTFSVADKSIA